jgi:putative flippase GtrA
MKSNNPRYIKNLLTDFSRFSVIGILATATYFMVANILIMSQVTSPQKSSVLAYLAGMIVSFFGQGQFTFNTGKTNFSQIIRFSILSICGLSISYGNLYIATNYLATNPFWAVLLTAIEIPVLSFFIMKNWVFSTK